MKVSVIRPGSVITEDRPYNVMERLPSIIKRREISDKRCVVGVIFCNLVNTETRWLSKGKMSLILGLRRKTLVEDDVWILCSEKWWVEKFILLLIRIPETWTRRETVLLQRVDKVPPETRFRRCNPSGRDRGSRFYRRGKWENRDKGRNKRNNESVTGLKQIQK